MRRVEWFWQDLRYAFRSLRRARALTAAAVITLALGIGATTTIFSLFEAVLLRRLPVESPSQLYFVAHGLGDPLSTSSHYPWFERVKQDSDVFAGVTAYNVRDLKVSSGAGVERVTGQYVSGNYHAVIGAPFQLGRGFVDENDRQLTPIAVISDAYWSRQYGRSRDVIGSLLTVGGQQVTIVGVTAASFDGMQPGQSIDVTLPLSMRIAADPEFVTATDTWTSMPLVVRLRQDVDPARARTVLASTYRDFMSLPENQRYGRMATGELREGTLLPAAQGSDRLRRGYETALYVLAVMVSLVLVVACVNVANLLLTRAPSRAREVALRMSLGAGRGRIVRQLLTESVLLAVGGGLLGVLLAAWGTRFVSILLQMGMRPIVIDLQPHTGVLLFALGLSVLTGIAFGVAPAWKTSGVDLVRSLKAGIGWRSGWRRPGQQALVAAQIAICLVLVFGSALMARTLRNLQGVDGGFRKASVVLFEIDARDTSFPRERLDALCSDIIARIGARPDVVSGSCSTMSPVATNTEGRPIAVSGFSHPSREVPPAFANSIDAAYFDTFGIEVLRGRPLAVTDNATATRVAVISEGLARYYFGNDDPIGRTFRFGVNNARPPITIVGIARDARQQLRDAAPHMAYTPLAQRDEPASGLLAAIRTSGETAGTAAAVRDVVRGLSRDVAVTYVRTMDQQIRAALVSERLLASLSGWFALLALVLASVGLYGMISSIVSRRLRDIGIMLALGARRAHVVGQVLRYAAVVTGAGLVVGIPAALAASGTLSSFLYGLAPDDVVTLASSVLVLGATALIAGYLPARRAARVDPAITLRAE
jgi:predicted permease